MVHQQQAERQAAHAYHVLYRGIGNKDNVTVVHSSDHYINDWDGIITQYLPHKNAGRGQFLVLFGTKRTGRSSRFSGEKC